MTHNKRSKTSRARGSWTHGYGEKKKHRGAGSRGGRGNAGSGKRGDAKKPSFADRVWGKHGFVNPTSEANITINVRDLSTLGAEKLNLTKLGYTKLLGSGNVTGKFEVTVASATESAIKKVEAAGGKVVLPESAE